MNRSILLICCVALLGCTNQTADDTQRNAGISKPNPSFDQIELLLNWFPEAEHGGYYAALVHGYYDQYRLKVKIIPGGPGLQVVPQIGLGRHQFGVSNADQVLKGSSRGAKTIAVMAPMQTSPRCIMIHESSGIRDIRDLKNITLSMSSTSTFSLFLQKHAPLTDVEIVPYSGSVALFMTREDFAQQAYVFSEPFVAKKKGARPHNLMLSDLGFNPYTSVLITSPDSVKKKHDVVQRMVQATIAGWKHYLRDPKKTNEYIHSLNSEMELDILEFGARELKPLCVPESTPRGRHVFGHMTAERWKTLTEQLADLDKDFGKVDPSTAFTTEFLASHLDP